MTQEAIDTNSVEQLQHAVYQQLEQCQDNCRELLKGTRMENSLVPINAQLNSLKARFRNNLSAGDQNNGGRTKFEPLTPAPVPMKPADSGTRQAPGNKTQAQIEGEQLAGEVEALYPGFRDREAGELLDALTDMQIRGVARKAGLEFTENYPERITLQTIEDIKKAIDEREGIKRVTGNPIDQVHAELQSAEDEIVRVQLEKAGIEKSLERERSINKRATQQARLVTLTERESQLAVRIDELKQSLVSNDVED